MGPESGTSWATCCGSGFLLRLPTSSPGGWSHLKEDGTSSSRGGWQECLVLGLWSKVLRSSPPGLFRELLVAWQLSSSEWVVREREWPGNAEVGSSRVFIHFHECFSTSGIFQSLFMLLPTCQEPSGFSPVFNHSTSFWNGFVIELFCLFLFLLS